MHTNASTVSREETMLSQPRRLTQDSFRLLVSGSREWVDVDALHHELLEFKEEYPALIILHGDAPKGADRFAREFAEKYNNPQHRYPADWERFGKIAGPKRNQLMVDTKPDYAIFFLKGKSSGTKDCLARAVKAGIEHHCLTD